MSALALNRGLVAMGQEPILNHLILEKLGHVEKKVDTSNQRVAALLERTRTQDREILSLRKHVMNHCRELAKITAKASAYGAVAGGIGLAIIELAKMWLMK